MWPFYTSNSGGGSNTSVSFGSGGKMTTTITSLPNVPIVIGGNVLAVDRFLGHVSGGARRREELEE